MRRKKGFALLILLMFLMSGMFFVGAVSFSEAHFRSLNNRAEAVQKAVNELIIFFRRQASLYATRRGMFYAAPESDRGQIKARAENGWFTREFIEDGQTYSEDDLQERFGPAFEAVDRALSTTTLPIRSFVVSIPAARRLVSYPNTLDVDEFGRITVVNTDITVEELFGVMFDEHDFILNCNVVVDIEFNNRYLPPMLEGRTRNISGAVVTLRSNGVNLMIPIRNISGLPNVL